MRDPVTDILASTSMKHLSGFLFVAESPNKLF